MAAAKNATPPSGRRRAEKTNIPTVLPMEYLTDSSDDSSDDDNIDAADGDDLAAPRRRTVTGIEKRLSRQAKGPKDQAIGSTVYRVAKKTDPRMAPVLAKDARNRKEALLQRGRAPAKAQAGFFR